MTDSSLGDPGPALLSRIVEAIDVSAGLAHADKYRMQSDPALLADVVDALAGLVPSATDVLVGLELGGVPIAVALSLKTGLPSAVLRRAVKAGTDSPLAGEPVTGRRTLLVTDMVQGGRKLTGAVDALRAAGAVVDHAAVAVAWHSSTRTVAQRAGIELHAVVTPEHVASLLASTNGSGQ